MKCTSIVNFAIEKEFKIERKNHSHFVNHDIERYLVQGSVSAGNVCGSEKLALMPGVLHISIVINQLSRCLSQGLVLLTA